MNVRLVEIFRAVMRHQTTVGAAHELDISQPAVSMALRQLEVKIGFPLFNRVGNRLSAREEAKILFDKSDPVFNLIKSLDSIAEELRDHRHGHLRIAATPQLGHSVLPIAVKRFLVGRPSVKISYDIERSSDVLEHVETGSADIGLAILLEREQSHTFDMTPLASTGLFCLVPRGHALNHHQVISPRDLQPYPLIAVNINTRLGPLVQAAFKLSGVPYHVSVEVNYAETACLLVVAGAGVTIVDGYSASNFRDHPQACPIPFQPDDVVDAWAVMPKSRTPSRLASAFLQVLRGDTDNYFKLPTMTIPPV